MPQCFLAITLRNWSSRRLPFVLASIVLLARGASAATLQFDTDSGALLVDVDDPAVKVSLDGRELKITGAGLEEVRLTAGPHLFRDDRTDELLTITRDERVVVRVRTRAERAERKSARSRDELMRDVRQIAGQLVSLRSELDDVVWRDVESRWTTTEAAKLLIAFFRGDGTLPGFSGTPAEARWLVEQLALLRSERALAFDMLSEVAGIDSTRPVSPLCGTWQVTEVSGAGGIAADALELYDPDPIGRTFVAANDTAALLSGAGLWLFDASYDEPGSVDFSAVVRGNTIYRGRYRVEGDEAMLRLSPMNAPRPTAPDGDPTDGGFVMRLRRINMSQ
ncbi:MAG: hypothetical protein WD851_18580 [Pirellulales bacterium]